MLYDSNYMYFQNCNSVGDRNEGIQFARFENKHQTDTRVGETKFKVIKKRYSPLFNNICKVPCGVAIFLLDIYLLKEL